MLCPIMRRDFIGDIDIAAPRRSRASAPTRRQWRERRNGFMDTRRHPADAVELTRAMNS